MTQVRDLLDAIIDGKSQAAQSAFNSILADKVSAALDARTQEVASQFNGMNEALIGKNSQMSRYTHPDIENKKAKGQYYAKGTVAGHKFNVNFDDFPSKNDIAKQNPHLDVHHVYAVHAHIDEHGDDDMTGTKSTQGRMPVHITSNGSND